ncbi:MAG: NusG domain II-containing protein [Gammaproteobacteria bacterium]|nr:NusG domain II-containing protein [Gammaproteobacteria bacterium]
MTVADRIVVVAASLLVGILFARYWGPAVPAAAVELRSGREVVARYPLDRDRRVDVQGRLGVSVLDIRDGRVRFIASPCRNKVCIHAGWLRHSGEAAACLPNRVSVSLIGGVEAEFDAVAF